MISIIILFILLLLIIPIGVSIIFIIGAYKTFEKAGVEGWKAIIPIYNTYVLTVEICKMNWWWFVLVIVGACIPYVGSIVALVASINIHYVLAKKFTNDEGQIILTCIFPNIMMCVFGFGNATFTDVPMSPNGFFASSEEKANYSSRESNNSANAGFCTNCGSALRAGDKFCINCGKEVIK